MKRLLNCLTTGAMLALLSSCSPGESGSSTPPASSSPGSSSSVPMSNPRTVISDQLAALKAGDVEKVKAGMSSRVRDEVTPEVVVEAKKEAGKMTIEELYDSAEISSAGGKSAAKIKMKNGRTLTTLVAEDGKWVADTVWFK